MILDIPETTTATVGFFDVVLFNGIIYHIQNPITALENLSRVARQVLTIETWIDMGEVNRPCMVYYPGEPLKPHHPQNGWGVNSLLMYALLKKVGFETVLEFETPGTGLQRSIFLAFKAGHKFRSFVEAHAHLNRPRVVAAP